MNHVSRRLFLKVLGSTGAGLAASQLPLMEALAAGTTASDEFFIFVHAQGGWDVTLWSDPRNQAKGLVDPATTANTDFSQIRLFQPLDQSASPSFQLLNGPNGLVFGPTIGDLFGQASRLTVINGLAMNTVSHPDGTWFSSTGRHLAGGRPVASSIDTMLSNEFGGAQLFPTVSINYPSSYLGVGLDQRVVPLKIGSVGTVAKTLTRSTSYETEPQRDAVTAMLSQEAADLAQISNDPTFMRALQSQYDTLPKMFVPDAAGERLADVFSQARLQVLQPNFFAPKFTRPLRFQGGTAVNMAFAVEAMKRNLVRSVSFATSASFDTHNTNYRFQPQTQQELFDLLSVLLNQLDATPHPTRTSDKLADHTHILVVSDFCRTPQINLSGGRDHYPNNTALIISPRFKNTVFGSTDPDQMLPADAGTFADGTRPVAPPDVLATFVSAFGVDPRKYLRDGDVIKQILNV